MENHRNKRYASVADISETEHVGMVREIFSTITARYDLLNHLLSLRRDIAWRRSAVRKMRFFRTYRFLDVATGTADLAIEAALAHPAITVTGIDFAAEMMNVGRHKISKRTLSDRVRLIQTDALNLPFADNLFDVTGIAFGIRNITNKIRALEEMKRVTTPGGQVMILEMNFPRQALFRSVYSAYLNRVMPRIVRTFSKNPAAYLYLADSIMHFPPPRDFIRLMEDAGLASIRKYPLTLGITYLYVGRIPGTRT